MKLEDFIKNLRNIDDGADIDRDMLVGIYERVKNSEFKPGADHVTQVLKVQQSIVGKLQLSLLPHFPLSIAPVERVDRDAISGPRAQPLGDTRTGPHSKNSLKPLERGNG